MGGPSALFFRRGTELSRTLSGIVSRDTALDASRLAPWVAGYPPDVATATPYEGIDLELDSSATGSSCAPGECSPRLEEAPAFVRRALDAAVDVALRGVRRAAVMTGGGVDSSVLLGLATRWAERTGGSVFAVSIDFEGPGDDRPHLRALEAHLKCEVLRVAPEEAASRIALMSTGADAAPAGFPTMPMEVEVLARARAHGAERMITGAGGDEMFDGNAWALAELALRGHPFAAARSARRLKGFGRRRAPIWSWVVRPLLGRTAPRVVRAFRAARRVDAVAPAWAGPLVRRFFERRRRALREWLPPPRTAQERFARFVGTAHRVVLAWARHQEERASGLDCWHPYLDRDLAAAVATLHPDNLLFGDRWRGLLREAVRDLLPATLLERMDKARFEPALRRWIDAAGGLRALRPLASCRQSAALGLVDPKPFAAAFETFVANPEDGLSWALLWPALSVEAFLRGRAA